MFVAFCDQVFGNSIPRCSKTGFSESPMTPSRFSHSSSSYGCTPGEVNLRSMTRPFSVVMAALEVALGISFLLSLGFWGEHRSILRPSDRTGPSLVRYLRGFSRRAPSPVRQSSRKLQIGAVVEFLQPVEAELGDPCGLKLAAGVADLPLHNIGNEGEAAGIDVALVAGPVEAAEQLLAIEGLAMAVPVDDDERLWDRPLVGGEAVAAGRALAAAAGGAVGDPAGLEGLRWGVAAGAVHSLKSTEV